MTASNGGIPSDEIKNYFNSIQSPFPVVVEGKIDTQQFLEASRGVVSLIGKFSFKWAYLKQWAYPSHSLYNNIRNRQAYFISACILAKF